MVVYLYNPFSAIVLSEVLDNLRNSVAETPRSVILVYFNPEQRHLIDESGMFSQQELEGTGNSSWAVYRFAEEDI